MPGGRRISQDEAARVFRRAAELDAHRGVAQDGTLDEQAVIEAGREAGLSELAVRRALDELDRGALMREREGGRRGRLGPAVMTTHRIVPGPASRIAAALPELMKVQLLESTRRTETMLLFTRRTDAIGQAMRGVKKPKLRFVRSVEVTLAPAGPDHVDVTLSARMGPARSVAGAGMALGGLGATSGTAAAVGVGLAVAHPLLLLAAPALAAGVGTAAASKRGYDAVVQVTSVGLEAVLDELAHGRPPRNPQKLIG